MIYLSGLTVITHHWIAVQWLFAVVKEVASPWEPRIPLGELTTLPRPPSLLGREMDLPPSGFSANRRWQPYPKSCRLFVHCMQQRATFIVMLFSFLLVYRSLYCYTMNDESRIMCLCKSVHCKSLKRVLTAVFNYNWVENISVTVHPGIWTYSVLNSSIKIIFILYGSNMLD